MKLPYKISDAASQLYRAGISYHAFGTVKQDNLALFDYFKCDKITAEQQKTIAEFCPDVTIRGCASQYAPELRAVLVCFPKAAWYRTNGVKKRKPYTIGKYLIVSEQLHNGGFSVSAIPDNGPTIRRQFFGYTQKELKNEIAAMVRLGF